MEILRELSIGPRTGDGAAVTVGSFDGVHAGHRRLLARLRAEARRLGGRAVVVTFDPHPRCVVDPAGCPPLLTSLDERLELIRDAGVDAAVVLAFTPALSRRTAIEFADDLIHGAAMRRLIVGPGFALGRGREGTVEFLTRHGERQGFDVVTVATATRGGTRLSSGRIRDALLAGRIGEATGMLGRRYAITGTVEPGRRVGAKLGFPTANLAVDPARCLPAAGIYAGWVKAAGRDHPAAVSIGYRPTYGEGPLTIEAHLLDFTGDLYGTHVRLEFARRLRAERRFAGERALAAQIDRDVARTRAVLIGQGAR